jgi:hypothetical protein
MPGSNGVGNARSLAMAYGAAAGRTGALPIDDAVLDRLTAADTADDVPAEATTGLGVGYAMNRLGLAVLDDVRSRNLREALLRCDA